MPFQLVLFIFMGRDVSFHSPAVMMSPVLETFKPPGTISRSKVSSEGCLVLSVSEQ